MNKQIRNQLFKTLDKIYKSSKRLSKSFGLNTISLLILKGSIDSARLKKDKTNTNVHHYIDKYNDMLDQLYKSCEETTKAVKAEHISPAVLKVYINQIKAGVNEGMKD